MGTERLFRNIITEEIHPRNTLPKLLLVDYYLLKKFKKRKVELHLTFNKVLRTLFSGNQNKTWQ